MRVPSLGGEGEPGQGAGSGGEGQEGACTTGDDHEATGWRETGLAVRDIHPLERARRDRQA